MQTKLLCQFFSICFTNTKFITFQKVKVVNLTADGLNDSNKQLETDQQIVRIPPHLSCPPEPC